MEKLSLPAPAWVLRDQPLLLLQRIITHLFAYFLSLVAEHPFDERLDLPSRFADGVKVQFSRNRVSSGDHVLHAGRQGLVSVLGFYIDCLYSLRIADSTVPD